MLVTKEWLRENYVKFNNKYWNGELPMVEFKISKSKHTWGYASYNFDRIDDTVIPHAITLSNYYDSPEYVKQTTLLHEMIHIYDYYTNPEHFIKNGKRISGHYYDAHGYFFKSEANRLAKDGWEIEKLVTASEMSVSSLSDESQKRQDKKIANSLLCVIKTKKYSFIVKTDSSKLKNVINAVNTNYAVSLKSYLGDSVKQVQAYKFDNERIASLRSCNKKLSGWKVKTEFLDDYLKNKCKITKKIRISA